MQKKKKMEVKKPLTSKMFNEITEFSDMEQLKMNILRLLSLEKQTAVFVYDAKQQQHLNIAQIPIEKSLYDFSEKEQTLIHDFILSTKENIKTILHPEGKPKMNYIVLDFHLEDMLATTADNKTIIRIKGYFACEKLIFSLDGRKVERMSEMTWDHVKQITTGWDCVKNCPKCLHDHCFFQDPAKKVEKSKMSVYSFHAAKTLSFSDSKTTVFFWNGTEHVNIHHEKSLCDNFSDFGCEEIEFINLIASTMSSRIKKHREEFGLERVVIVDVHPDDHINVDVEGPSIVRFQFIISANYLTMDGIQIDMKKLTWEQYMEIPNFKTRCALCKI